MRWLVFRIGHDGNGDFTHSRQIEHVELAGDKLKAAWAASSSSLSCKVKMVGDSCIRFDKTAGWGTRSDIVGAMLIHIPPQRGRLPRSCRCPPDTRQCSGRSPRNRCGQTGHARCPACAPAIAGNGCGCPAGPGSHEGSHALHEAAVPLAHMGCRFRRQAPVHLMGMAKAGGADGSAIAAGQAARSHLIPAGMFQTLINKGRKSRLGKPRVCLRAAASPCSLAACICSALASCSASSASISAPASLPAVTTKPLGNSASERSYPLLRRGTIAGGGTKTGVRQARRTALRSGKALCDGRA